MRLKIKRKVYFFAFWAVLFFTGSVVFALDKEAVVGNYELTGVMETAGMLRLMADQKYAAGFSYGAADWVEEGTWKIEGDEVVLQGGRFKVKNYKDLSLVLPAGTRFKYKDGKLTASDPKRKLVFLDPNKTPTPPGEESGEGRMRVKGKVVKIDNETLIIQSGECMTFDVHGLSEKVIKTAKEKQGKAIDVEIPYSAILSSGGCG